MGGEASSEAALVPVTALLTRLSTEPVMGGPGRRDEPDATSAPEAPSRDEASGRGIGPWVSRHHAAQERRAASGPPTRSRPGPPRRRGGIRALPRWPGGSDERGSAASASPRAPSGILSPQAKLPRQAHDMSSKRPGIRPIAPSFATHVGHGTGPSPPTPWRASLPWACRRSTPAKASRVPSLRRRPPRRVLTRSAPRGAGQGRRSAMATRAAGAASGETAPLGPRTSGSR